MRSASRFIATEESWRRENADEDIAYSRACAILIAEPIRRSVCCLTTKHGNYLQRCTILPGFLRSRVTPSAKRLFIEDTRRLPRYIPTTAGMPGFVLQTDRAQTAVPAEECGRHQTAVVAIHADRMGIRKKWSPICAGVFEISLFKTVWVPTSCGPSGRY